MHFMKDGQQNPNPGDAADHNGASRSKANPQDPKDPAAKPVAERWVVRPQWCPGPAVKHDCNCGVMVVYGAKPPAAALVPLPPAWYRGASPAALLFWLGLVGKLGRRGAYRLAEDALRHGLALEGFFRFCRARGLAGPNGPRRASLISPN